MSDIEREEFERWAASNVPDADFDLQDNKDSWPGQHQSYHLQCMWEGWQAARAQSGQGVEAVDVWLPFGAGSAYADAKESGKANMSVSCELIVEIIDEIYRLNTHPQPAQQGSVPEDLRERVFSGWSGCSNHDCIVTGPKKGIGTNGSCGCLHNASRTQLSILKSRLQSIFAEPQPEGDGCIKCSERLPTEADGDPRGDVWVWDKIFDAWVLANWESVGDITDYTQWMPTGLKRPTPPQEQ